MKKKQKTQHLQGISDMIQGEKPLRLRDHSVGLNALGCSISSPDMSQSNCCQVNCFTSSWFLGQRNLPWTSIRLYSSTNPSDSQSKALILSQRFPQKRYRALRLSLGNRFWAFQHFQPPPLILRKNEGIMSLPCSAIKQARSGGILHEFYTPP